MWQNGPFKPSIGSHAVVYVARGKLNITRVFNGTATCVLMTWHRVLCISLYVFQACPSHYPLLPVPLLPVLLPSSPKLCLPLPLYPLPLFPVPGATCASSFLCFCFPPNLVERSSCLLDTATQAPQAQEYGSRTKRYFSKTQPYFQSSGFFVHQP